MKYTGSPRIAPTQLSHVRKTLRLLVDAWSTITWRQLAWTLPIGILIELLFVTVSHGFFLFLQASWAQRLTMYWESGWIHVFVAFFFLLCVVAADYAVRNGAPRFRTFVLAAVTAATLGASFDSLVRYFGLGWFDQPYVRWWWKPVHPISHFMWYLLIGGFFMFVYADMQRSRESAARLHAAVLRRARAARNVLQTRLQAMQARVEPQLLFDTLGRVKAAYRTDAGQGQRALDDLIAYLRMAMPQMHDSASTLGREIELIRSYVAVVAGNGSSRVRLTIDGIDDASRIPFPPSLLLPLVEHVIARAGPEEADHLHISVRTVRAQDRVQVTLGHGVKACAGQAESDVVRQAREHLRVLFDGQAHLGLRVQLDGINEIVIDVPR